mgnify:CR=1 FL=1
MKSVKSIYKIGKGPSSSHTMGPFKCITHYVENHPEADRLHVTLYGSLAATGKGHLTDQAVTDAFPNGDVTIEWKPKEVLPYHPNGMKVAAINSDGDLYDKWTYFSVGGGDIVCLNKPIDSDDEAEVYEMNTMQEILKWCNDNGKTFWEFVAEHEKDTPGFWEHLENVWKVMQKAVERGIDEEGALPGPLGLRRKAGSYFIKADGRTRIAYTRLENIDEVLAENPYFKVLVGGCVTSEEAIVLLGRITPNFPKAYITREDIKLTELAQPKYVAEPAVAPAPEAEAVVQ